MNEVKFSVFADYHYYPSYFRTCGLEGITQIINRAVENNADFIIHVGDLCHTPDKFPELISLYENAPIPAFHCTGNHEFENSSLNDVLKAYHLENSYYYFDVKGFRFIVLDLNNMLVDGQNIHYENGSWQRSKYDYVASIDKKQLNWLEKTIMSSNGPCILFSHHSLERARSGISPEENEKIREMLKRVNKDKKRVFMAVNGHYHRDYLRLRDNIAFLDLNSASNEWLEPKHSGFFPQEIYDKYICAEYNVMWNDPLNAIVTIREDGYIKIEGMESEFFCGVSHTTLGRDPFDKDGRECTPRISSHEFKLF